MSTVKISSALPDQVTLAAEIAQLRELDVSTSSTLARGLSKDAPFTCPAISDARSGLRTAGRPPREMMRVATAFGQFSIP